MNIKDLEKEENEGVDTLPSEERRKFLQIGLAVTGVFLGGTVLSLSSVSTAKGSVDGVSSIIPVKGQFPYPKQIGRAHV